MSVANPITPELLTKDDVAKIIQVSPRHVENLVRDGRLPQPIRLGVHPRWRRMELLTFLDSLNPSSGDGVQA